MIHVPSCYNATTGYLNYKKASDILYKGLEVTVDSLKN